MPATMPPPNSTKWPNRDIKAAPSYPAQSCAVYHPEDEEALWSLLKMADPNTLPSSLRARLAYKDIFVQRPSSQREIEELIQVGLLVGVVLKAEDLPAIFGMLDAYRTQLSFYRYVASIFVGYLEESPFGDWQASDGVATKLKTQLAHDTQALPISSSHSLLREVAGKLGHSTADFKFAVKTPSESAD